MSKGQSVGVMEFDKTNMDFVIFYDEILVAIVINEGEMTSSGVTIRILAETEDEVAEATPQSSVALAQ